MKVQKKERITSRNVHFEAMDTNDSDPAATPATKADLQQLLAVVQAQHKTIESQSKQLKSVSGKRAPSSRARSPTPTPKPVAKAKEAPKKGSMGRTNKRCTSSTNSS